MLYVEVSMMSVLPASQGGMVLLEKFKMVWYKSTLFYVNVIFISVIVVACFTFEKFVLTKIQTKKDREILLGEFANIEDREFQQNSIVERVGNEF